MNVYGWDEAGLEIEEYKIPDALAQTTNDPKMLVCLVNTWLSFQNSPNRRKPDLGREPRIETLEGAVRLSAVFGRDCRYHLYIGPNAERLAQEEIGSEIHA